MTEPVRPLEALIDRKERRENLTRMVAHADKKGIPLTRVMSAKQVRFMYDQLVLTETLLQATAPPAPTADKGECPGCGCSSALCVEYRLHGQVCCPDCSHRKTPAAPPERVSEGKEPAQDLDWLKGLAEWHTRTAAMERDPVLAAFHATAAEMLGAL